MARGPRARIARDGALRATAHPVGGSLSRVSEVSARLTAIFHHPGGRGGVGASRAVVVIIFASAGEHGVCRPKERHR